MQGIKFGSSICLFIQCSIPHIKYNVPSVKISTISGSLSKPQVDKWAALCITVITFYSCIAKLLNVPCISTSTSPSIHSHRQLWTRQPQRCLTQMPDTTRPKKDKGVDRQTGIYK